MNTVEVLKNNIIDKILTIDNEEYLSSLFTIVNNNYSVNDKIILSEDQILMLKKSDEDIKNGRLISQEKLNEIDLKWLKEL